jgi:hypothetical protein
MKTTVFRRTRMRTALLAAGMVVAAAAVLASPAQAQHAQSLQPSAAAATESLATTEAAVGILAAGPGTTYQGSDGWCHYNAWGGSFYCLSQYNYTLPNGYHQVFVIGTNSQVYTKWQSGSGVSGWLSLGGQCISPGHHSVDLYQPNGWTFKVACVGTNGRDYYRTRYSDGNWSKWIGPTTLNW